jgi:hypothetical protein
MNISIHFNWKQFLLLPIGAAALLISCEKGDAGPQGAQGPQGATGAQGPSGSANEKIYDFAVSSSDWSGGIGVWTYSGQLPTLTQGIIDTGSVYVYWTENETQTLMPFTVSGVDYMYYTSILSGTGTLEVTVTIAGPYTFSNPSALSPVTLKVIIDP